MAVTEDVVAAAYSEIHKSRLLARHYSKTNSDQSVTIYNPLLNASGRLSYVTFYRAQMNLDETCQLFGFNRAVTSETIKVETEDILAQNRDVTFVTRNLDLQSGELRKNSQLINLLDGTPVNDESYDVFRTITCKRNQ